MIRDTEDVLVSRALDGTATAQDWAALEALAQQDRDLWKRMAAAARADAALRRGVAEATVAAERAELPHPSELARHVAARGRLARGRKAALWIWSGWAAAAAVASAWVGSGWSSAAPAGSQPGPAVAAAPATGPLAPVPDLLEELARDLGGAARFASPAGEGGQLLWELPGILVESRPAADGHSVDMLYLRPFLERCTADRFYQLGRDELGQPVAVPVSTRPGVRRPPL